MRLTIDTDNKTITIDGCNELEEVIKAIKKLLPNGEWREYKLDATPRTTYDTYPYTWICPNTGTGNPVVYDNTTTCLKNDVPTTLTHN